VARSLLCSTHADDSEVPAALLLGWYSTAACYSHLQVNALAARKASTKAAEEQAKKQKEDYERLDTAQRLEVCVVAAAVHGLPSMFMCI
jgi:hypothetical protein